MASDQSALGDPESRIGFTIPTNAQAIYGTVLIAGIIAGESIYNPSPRIVLITSVAMLVIFFLTHVYADVAAGAGAEAPLWDRIVTEARTESPMLLAVVAPGVALATAVLGRGDAANAISLSLWVCVAQLVGSGVLLARRRRLSWWATAANEAMCGACGLAVIVLKTLVY
jgi:hypothetical protein